MVPVSSNIFMNENYIQILEIHNMVNEEEILVKGRIEV